MALSSSRSDAAFDGLDFLAPLEEHAEGGDVVLERDLFDLLLALHFVLLESVAPRPTTTTVRGLPMP